MKKKAVFPRLNLGNNLELSDVIMYSFSKISDLFNAYFTYANCTNITIL